MAAFSFSINEFFKFLHAIVATGIYLPFLHGTTVTKIMPSAGHGLI
jgi:hypothetical protein